MVVYKTLTGSFVLETLDVMQKNFIFIGLKLKLC